MRHTSGDVRHRGRRQPPIYKALKGSGRQQNNFTTGFTTQANIGLRFRQVPWFYQATIYVAFKLQLKLQRLIL
jgi:hypothetical protein